MQYPLITLCGSTRFKDEFLEMQKQLTLKGYIVLTVGLFGHSGDNEVWEGMDEVEKEGKCVISFHRKTTMTI